MIKTADECLFRAKAGGRDRACGHEIETALGLVAHG
jgi:PleD family two-component response regulator